MTPANVLLRALEDFLRNEVQKQLSGFSGYQNRIASNLLSLLSRDEALRPVLAALDRDMATDLSLDAATMPQALSVALRDGQAQDSANVRRYLRQRALLSLAIDNPRYSGCLQARQRWADDAARIDILIEH